MRLAIGLFACFISAVVNARKRYLVDWNAVLDVAATEQ